MKRVEELFDVFYGTDLELINCEEENMEYHSFADFK